LIVGGADGCRTGWVVCRRDTDGSLDIGVVKTLAEACEGLSILAVDMPIGLTDTPRPGRACEGEARALMPGKASSVFPTPCRPALAGTTHAEANAISRKLDMGLNQQPFICSQAARVDELMRAASPARRLRGPPELAFTRMNGGKPVLAKRQPGFAERHKLLARRPWKPEALSGAARDDMLDAMASAARC
jgi:predicted RNase H-like nuclease